MRSRTTPAADDPALPFLITAELGEALQSDGHRAARDAFATALDLPESWGTESRLRTELAELYRRRFDLWLRVGDLSCQLADPAIAFEAYERASSTPTLDPGAVLPRRVFAAMRSGRPAQRQRLCSSQSSVPMGVSMIVTLNWSRISPRPRRWRPVLAPAALGHPGNSGTSADPFDACRLDRIVAAAADRHGPRMLLESATRCPVGCRRDCRVDRVVRRRLGSARAPL